MARINVPWSFFDARTALPDGLSYDAKRALWFRGRTLTAGELGCFASHFVLWQSLVRDPDCDAYCIIEDDVVLDWSFFSSASDFPELFGDHGFVRFYAKLPVPMTTVGAAGRRHLVRFKRPPYGTQGYYISKSAAAKFLASITEVVRPIDDEIDRVWAHGVPSIGVFPFPLFELGLASTIEDQRRATVRLTGSDLWKRLLARSREKLRKVIHFRSFRV
ncbi:glycosyltransferase family 25 protein [Terrihabitans soli]